MVFRGTHEGFSLTRKQQDRHAEWVACKSPSAYLPRERTNLGDTLAKGRRIMESSTLTIEFKCSLAANARQS